MPLIFERNDITKMHTDAIVLSANERLKQGSGTSRAIFQAAGEETMRAACDSIGHCDMGRAVITSGFDLDAEYIIHAVCPRWYGGGHNESQLLYSAYIHALKLAQERQLQSIAFPLLSAGNYNYPRDKALQVASHAFTDFLTEYEMDIYMVLYDSESVKAGGKLSPIKEQIKRMNMWREKMSNIDVLGAILLETVSV